MPILLWFSDIEIIKKILSSRGFIELQRLIISMQIKPTEKTRFIYQKKGIRKINVLDILKL